MSDAAAADRAASRRGSAGQRARVAGLRLASWIACRVSEGVANRVADLAGPRVRVADLADDDEFGFGRPFVLKEDGLFKMWYSIRTRSKGYRLGYAESRDGQSWTRKDSEVGIDVSAHGWDSEMICFACVQRTRYGTYMFYNGNNYGETGFGVAVWQD